MADPRTRALQLLIKKDLERQNRKNEPIKHGLPGGVTHDGRASQRIVLATVDEILSTKRNYVKRREIPIEDMAVINQSSDFLERKNHEHQEGIPHLSAWKNVRKSHTTLKKKQMINFCKRMSSNAPNFVRMRLACEEIDDNFARMIADAIRKNSHGNELLLYGNNISDEGVRLLVDGLRSHPLQYLSLGGNLLTDESARRLSDLCHQNKKIRFLNVSNRWPRKKWMDRPEDPHHPRITMEGARFFADRIAHNGCGLVALYLSDQRIGDLGAIALFEALKSNSKMQVLSLDRNGLTDVCCTALQEFLSCSDPTNNHNDDAAAMMEREHEPLLLGSLLDEGSVDSEVMILPQATTDVTLVAVAPISANGNVVMPTVDIESNVNETIIALGLQDYNNNNNYNGANYSTNSAVSRSGREVNVIQVPAVTAPKLRMLTLTGNAIGDSGAIQIAFGLGTGHCNLGALSLEANMIGDEGMDALAKCLYANRSLRLLVLRGNPYHGSETNPAAGAVDAILKARREGGAFGEEDNTNWDNDEFRALFSAYMDNGVGGAGGYNRAFDWDNPMGLREESFDGAEHDGGEYFNTPKAAAAAAAAAVVVGSGVERSQKEGLTSSLSPIKPPTSSFSGNLVDNNSVTSSVSLGTPYGTLQQLQQQQQQQLSPIHRATSSSKTLLSPSAARMAILPVPSGTSIVTATTEPSNVSKGEKSSSTATSSKGNSASTATAETSTCRALLSAARTPLFPSTPYSSDMGKTIGLPFFGHANEGSMPIRTLTERFVDSKQHLMNLRVSRPEDPPGSRPTSVVKIGADRENTILQIKAERQTAEYKYEKIDRMTTERRNQRQRAAIKPPPDKFWTQWKSQLTNRYPRGIDQASGVKSNVFDETTPVIDYDGKFLEKVQAGVKPDKRMVLLKSAPEAFAHHRLEKAVKIEIGRKKTEELMLQNEAATAQDPIDRNAVDRYEKFAGAHFNSLFKVGGVEEKKKRKKEKRAATANKVSFARSSFG